MYEPLRDVSKGL